MDWRVARQKAGLSQSELAALAGVSQSLIAKLEAGRLDPSFARAQRILAVLEQHSVSDSDWVRSVMVPFPSPIWETQTISSALVLLEQLAVPALPVQNERGVIVGLFHIQPLLDDVYFSLNLGQKKRVLDVMIAPYFLPLSASRPEILSILRSRGVVLLGSASNPLGWVLPYSVLKWASVESH